MTAPASSAILAELLQVRVQLAVIAELYGPAEQVAYSGTGPGEAKAKVTGSDPVGELAVATVTEDGKPTEVAAIRASMVRAGKAVHAMGRNADRAIAALNRVVRPNGEIVYADAWAPTTHKVRRWTVEELEAAEAAAWTRRRGATSTSGNHLDKPI